MSAVEEQVTFLPIEVVRSNEMEPAQRLLEIPTDPEERQRQTQRAVLEARDCLRESMALSRSTTPFAVRRAEELRQTSRQWFESAVRLSWGDMTSMLMPVCGFDNQALEEVLQETYLRAFRSLSSFEGDARFTTWAYRIGRNVRHNHIIKWHRHENMETVEEKKVRMIGSVAAADELALTSFKRAKIIDMLKLLRDDRDRAIIYYHHGLGMPHEEIAPLLGIKNQQASKARLWRAMRALHQKIDEMGLQAEDFE